jgi:hypothetical protein
MLFAAMGSDPMAPDDIGLWVIAALALAIFFIGLAGLAFGVALELIAPAAIGSDAIWSDAIGLAAIEFWAAATLPRDRAPSIAAPSAKVRGRNFMFRLFRLDELRRDRRSVVSAVAGATTS